MFIDGALAIDLSGVLLLTADTRTDTRARTRTNARTRVHTHSHAHTHTHARTHARTRARAHTRGVRARARTGMHNPKTGEVKLNVTTGAYPQYLETLRAGVVFVSI